MVNPTLIIVREIKNGRDLNALRLLKDFYNLAYWQCEQIITGFKQYYNKES